MSYQVKLDAFEGPMDLLLHLIHVNEVDIYDIPIAAITQQYLAYLQAMEEFDLEITSEFLVMAATLLSIKARLLLPRNEADSTEEYQDPRLELVYDLLAYQSIKEAALFLQNQNEAESSFIKRPHDEGLFQELYANQNFLDGRTLDELTKAFQAIWARSENQVAIAMIRRSDITIGEKMALIVQKLKQNKSGVLFGSLFGGHANKIELIITFLALLELIRMNIIKAEQNQSQIYIFPLHLGTYQRKIGNTLKEA